MMDSTVLGRFVPVKIEIGTPQEEADRKAARALGYAAGRHLRQALSAARVSGM
jgi:hypothetical protein